MAPVSLQGCDLFCQKADPLHLCRLIGVGQTNDSLSRLVGVSSMYSKKSSVFHILIHSPFFSIFEGGGGSVFAQSHGGILCPVSIGAGTGR